jgi:Transposase and inactivated derivatives
MDIHKDTVVVCVLPPVGGEGKTIRKTYGTFRNDLIRMRTCFKQLKVTEIAMESTGVYWRPVWNVLEDKEFRLLLVNPAQVKALAGRKSDGRDAQRIAQFLQDGRLDASFVPPPEMRELRLLLRHRVSLLEQRNEVHNQIRDLFETASIKLSSVVTDLLGVSGRRIIEALIRGEDSPEVLSWKVRGRLRAKEKLVKESLKGYFTEFHRSMLEAYYRHYQFLTQQVADFEQRTEARMEPYAQQVQLLVTIPGVDQIVAWTMIAELGVDLSVFPDGDHCASWAGMVPGENESAGKKKRTRCRKGNQALKRVLTQAAWAASHCKKGYLPRFFRRIQANADWGRAIGATAHKILIIAFQMLKTNTPYRDLGDDYFDRRHPARTTRKLVARLEALGHHVELTKKGPLPGITN